MKTKGVAVSTIIMVMLGVIVLLFVGYWLVRTFTGSTLSKEECRSEYIQWCRTCAGMSWTGTATWEASLVSCLGKYASNLGFTIPLGPSGACGNAVNQANCGVVGISV
jgi:hypothetical protein